MGLLNVDRHYNSLLDLFDKGVEKGFIEDSERHVILPANTRTHQEHGGKYIRQHLHRCIYGQYLEYPINYEDPFCANWK